MCNSQSLNVAVKTLSGLVERAIGNSLKQISTTQTSGPYLLMKALISFPNLRFLAISNELLSKTATNRFNHSEKDPQNKTIQAKFATKRTTDETLCAQLFILCNKQTNADSAQRPRVLVK